MIDQIRSDDPIRRKIETLGTTLSLPTVRKALGILEGAHASNKRFGADDVVDIHAYEPGDEAKRIDWKTSARAGRPMVVQRERPSTSKAWLLLDVGQEMTATCPSSEHQDAGKVIELRAYQVVGGVWKYFTVDDEQTDLDTKDYLAIGTLVSYEKLRDYYGAERIVPIYVEVEDGMRLARALDRERSQIKPNYDEMCRRFLADSADFSEENLEKAGIKKRFQNEELQKCVEKITEFIFQSK